MKTGNNDHMLSDAERIKRLEYLMLERAKPKVNHLLHVILSVATGGFWLIPYAFIVYKASK